MRIRPIVLALLLAGLPAAPALAQVQPPRIVSMTGTGTVKAAPDMVDISAGVVTEAPAAASALTANTARMNGIFVALDRLGILKRNIQTSSFDVSPVYDGGNNAPRRLTGYRVSNELHVTLDDIGKAGATLDALVAAGVNEMNGLSFSMREPATLLAQARADAVADARLRAQQYAAAAGLSLGPIVSLSEGGNAAPRPLLMAPMMAGARAVPIAAGEESVSATVTIVWEIR